LWSFAVLCGPLRSFAVFSHTVIYSMDLFVILCFE